MRVCPPPPLGLAIRHTEFRKAVMDEIVRFSPDVVLIDPWNAIAPDDKARDYLDTFELLRGMIPAKDDSPALGIIAHTRTATLSSPHRKTERIEARVSPGFKELVEQAATLSGHNLSSYVLFALSSTTRRTMEEHQQTALNADASRSLVRALLAPPRPNRHLRSAFAKYRQVTGGVR